MYLSMHEAWKTGVVNCLVYFSGCYLSNSWTINIVHGVFSCLIQACQRSGKEAICAIVSYRGCSPEGDMIDKMACRRTC